MTQKKIPRSDVVSALAKLSRLSTSSTQPGASYPHSYSQTTTPLINRPRNPFNQPPLQQIHHGELLSKGSLKLSSPDCFKSTSFNTSTNPLPGNENRPRRQPLLKSFPSTTILFRRAFSSRNPRHPSRRRRTQRRTNELNPNIFSSRQRPPP